MDYVRMWLLLVIALLIIGIVALWRRARKLARVAPDVPAEFGSRYAMPAELGSLSGDSLDSAGPMTEIEAFEREAAARDAEMEARHRRVLARRRRLDWLPWRRAQIQILALDSELDHARARVASMSFAVAYREECRQSEEQKVGAFRKILKEHGIPDPTERSHGYPWSPSGSGDSK